MNHNGLVLLVGAIVFVALIVYLLKKGYEHER